MPTTCTTAPGSVGWTADTFARGHHVRTGTLCPYWETGSSILRKILAAAAIAGLAGLTACSISTPAPAGSSSASSQATSAAPTGSPGSTGKATPSASSGTAAATAAGGVKDACELFNTLYASYKAVQNNDPNAFEDIYLESEKAKGTISGNLRNLFASLSLLAIDHSAAAERNGGPEQASKDAVRDAVFANAGACTAEGVTLRL
jgi:hypothetical protein